jgi:predicted nucleic acid-binding protein
VIDVTTRVYGNDPETAHERVRWLVAGGLLVVDVDEQLALAAGALRARWYDRQSRPLSIADCLALATAQHRVDRLATADPALADTARQIGVDVVPLPDSTGRRP